MSSILDRFSQRLQKFALPSLWLRVKRTS